MSRTTFVLQAVIVALVACTVAHGQCSLQTSCSSCIANSGCGWANLNTCSSGTSSGPYSGVATSWYWWSCPSSSGCSSYFTCAACNGHSSCFWDGVSCISGSNLGTTCSGSSSCTYSTCSSCITNANCMWNGVSCVAGTNFGSFCWSDSGLVDSSVGLGVGIILVIIFVPVVVLVTVTSAVCWWYRRVYMIRRATTVVVSDAGLAAGVASPYVAIQTGTGINTVVY